MKPGTFYLDFYNHCMQTGYMDDYGLCRTVINGVALSFFEPTAEYNVSRGYDKTDDWYWGYNGERQNGESDYDRRYKFTELRQTIVLFLAAMNDEL